MDRKWACLVKVFKNNFLIITTRKIILKADFCPSFEKMNRRLFLMDVEW